MTNVFTQADQFYPTPDKTIALMCDALEGNSKYFPSGRSFLEPSAGDGRIADYLSDKKSVGNIKCIEIDPNLTAILQQKGYSVIDSDFLQYNDPYHFDIVIMNPPFRNGADHFIKAWEVVAEGGTVVCLLPTVFSDPEYSKNHGRKRIQDIVAEHGKWQHIGNQFVDADRTTQIDVSIAIAHKPKSEFSYGFEGEFDTEYDIEDKEFSANPLANVDLLQSLVDQYNAGKTVIAEIAQLRKKQRYYMSGIEGQAGREHEQGVQRTLQEELDELKSGFWRYIFERTKIGDVTTSDFQKKFYAQLDAQKQMAFTVHNIRQILQVFYVNRGKIMKECLWNIFKTATSYHEKNKIHREGWKTNKSYRLNKKIIHPYGVDTTYDRWSCYGSRDFFMDLDKALCMLSGFKVENIQTVYDTLHSHCDKMNSRKWGREQDYNVPYNAWLTTSFFKVKMFKKGTVHLQFLDEKLLEQFNIQVAKDKGWIGGGY